MPLIESQNVSTLHLGWSNSYWLWVKCIKTAHHSNTKICWKGNILWNPLGIPAKCMQMSHMLNSSLICRFVLSRHKVRFLCKICCIASVIYKCTSFFKDFQVPDIKMMHNVRVMLSSNLKAAHNSHLPNSMFPSEFPQCKKMQALYKKNIILS